MYLWLLYLCFYLPVSWPGCPSHLLSAFFSLSLSLALSLKSFQGKDSWRDSVVFSASLTDIRYPRLHVHIHADFEPVLPLRAHCAVKERNFSLIFICFIFFRKLHLLCGFSETKMWILRGKMAFSFFRYFGVPLPGMVSVKQHSFKPCGVETFLSPSALQ